MRNNVKIKLDKVRRDIENLLGALKDTFFGLQDTPPYQSLVSLGVLSVTTLGYGLTEA